MDLLTQIRRPVAADLERYRSLFAEALSHPDDFLGQALAYISRRTGKMMRPLLVLLMAKEVGEVRPESLRSAVTLELLHTASLVHDDVVDESTQRRGQASANAVYDNKVAVLLGDYLLSTALLQASMTGSMGVVRIISTLGGTLSEGEIFQLNNIRQEVLTEEAYFHIIHCKTAALFAASAELGALSAGADEAYVARARRFGELVGTCFQIRDDIFDYYPDDKVGKPTGNDMREGKITLPALYALNACPDDDMHEVARRIKTGQPEATDIEDLVTFTKENGGIDYARSVMEQLHAQAKDMLPHWHNENVRQALAAYSDFVIARDL